MKVIKSMGKILILFGIFGLIWLNKYYLEMNEALAFGISVFWVIAWNVIWGRKNREDNENSENSGKNGDGKKEDGKNENVRHRGKLGKAAWCFLNFMILLFMFAATMMDPYWNSSSRWENAIDPDKDGLTILTRKEAMEDLNYAMKYLKKIHPFTCGGLPEDVKAREEKVREELQQLDEIESYVLCRKIESIFALLGDTYVSESYKQEHVMKYCNDMAKKGYTCIGINGQRLEDFLKEHSGYISYDLESYGIMHLKSRISNIEGLQYLEVDLNKPIIYNYMDPESGELFDLTVTKEDFMLKEEYLEMEEKKAGNDTPVVVEDRGFVYYDIYDEESLAVLTLKSCRYNDQYCDTVAKMFEEVYDKHIQNVAVDLRDNGGGNSTVADEFIGYLDVDHYRDWKMDIRYRFFMMTLDASEQPNKKKGHGFSGNVYVITNVASFSSAMDFAMLIQDNGLGKVVGEASGNFPAACGDVVNFRLPNSNLVMQISRKKWYRVDESKGDLPILPDVECSPEKALDVVKGLCVDK